MSFERYRRARGVSLVESLIAIAIFGFGLLGLTRLQLHLVRNAGGAAHRVEAIRMAQQKLEEFRGLQDGTAPDSGEDPSRRLGNSEYTRGWTVISNDTNSQMVASVTVRWSEASGAESNGPRVNLSTVISISDTTDAGHLVLPPTGGVVKLISRRHASIPPAAVALRGANKGRSVLKDPSNEDVFLVIDDTSGLVIAHCSFLPGDSTSIQNECSLQGEALLQGYIVGAEPADAAAIRFTSESSTSGAASTQCEVSRATGAENRVIVNSYRYQCRIAMTTGSRSPDGALSWGGHLSFPLLSVGVSACRYADDGAPASYTEVHGSLDNQNFLLTAERTCPSGTVLQSST